MASVPIDQFVVLSGIENLTLYQWHTKIAKHYFCKTCGIYTHHLRRSAPNEYAFNVACIEDMDEIDEAEIVQLNGANDSAFLK